MPISNKNTAEAAVEKRLKRITTQAFIVGAIVGAMLGFALGFLVGYNQVCTTLIVPLSEGIKT